MSVEITPILSPQSLTATSVTMQMPQVNTGDFILFVQSSLDNSRTGDAPLFSAVSDSAGNSYVQNGENLLFNVTGRTYNFAQQIFSTRSIATIASGTNITFNFSNTQPGDGVAFNIFVAVISGAASVGDIQQNIFVAPQTSPIAAPATISSNQQVVLSVFSGLFGSGFSAQPGYTFFYSLKLLALVALGSGPDFTAPAGSNAASWGFTGTFDGAAISNLSLTLSLPLSAKGFAPCWLEGQHNKGLGVYIATGLVNGILVNGQVIYVAPNATSYIWVEADGTVASGTVVPGGAAAIAIVVAGTVIVGGNQPPSLLSPIGKWGGLSTEDGILNITDIREF